MSDLDIAQAQMEEVDRHPAAILKEILVIAKAAFTIVGTLQAAWAWRKSGEKMAKPAQFFLIFNSMIVAAVTYYKFTSKMIAPLFLLQGLSHYSVFLVFVVLWTYGDNKRLEEQRKKHNSTVLRMHVAYWAVLALGFHLCECSADTPYPISFVLSDGLFFLTYYLLLQLRKAGFDFKKDKDGNKTLLEVQVDNYFASYWFLVKWHTLELFLGRILFETVLEGAIYCTLDGGNKWLYRSWRGALFLMLHILGTMQGVGVARNVFIKNAKASGMFGGFEEEAVKSAKKT